MPSVLSRRPGGADEQRRRTRERIELATIELLAEGHAFAGLSIGDISARASVSRPTFYTYFADKRALVLALGARLEVDVREAAKEWLQDRTDDLPTTLRAVLDAFAAHRETVRAVVEAATYDEDVAAFWREFHAWFIDNAVGRARSADPDLPDEDAEALAHALVWMTERAFTEHLEAPRAGDEAILRAVERLWRSVVPATDEGTAATPTPGR
ncbi:MAG: TetR/AcrR family transcriptional regulator [Solirubrobacteraceae bacterium]|nr:TetR/AcrR family transcriptional regulator [Solirubrobacteraceae bacterium]